MSDAMQRAINDLSPVVESICGMHSLCAAEVTLVLIGLSAMWGAAANDGRESLQKRIEAAGREDDHLRRR